MTWKTAIETKKIHSPDQYYKNLLIAYKKNKYIIFNNYIIKIKIFNKYNEKLCSITNIVILIYFIPK